LIFQQLIGKIFDLPIRYITERFYVIMSYIVELYTQCMSGY